VVQDQRVLQLLDRDATNTGVPVVLRDSLQHIDLVGGEIPHSGRSHLGITVLPLGSKEVDKAHGRFLVLSLRSTGRAKDR